jgi:hypothetical protein
MEAMMDRRLIMLPKPNGAAASPALVRARLTRAFARQGADVSIGLTAGQDVRLFAINPKSILCP